MGLLINMQKSVYIYIFLALWEKYDTYGCEILQNESIFDKESEHLDGIRKFFVWKDYACAACRNDKLKKLNIVQFYAGWLGILQISSIIPSLSKINWALSILPLSGKIHLINFFSFA